MFQPSCPTYVENRMPRLPPPNLRAPEGTDSSYQKAVPEKAHIGWPSKKDNLDKNLRNTAHFLLEGACFSISNENAQAI